MYIFAFTLRSAPSRCEFHLFLDSFCETESHLLLFFVVVSRGFEHLFTFYEYFLLLEDRTYNIYAGILHLSYICFSFEDKFFFSRKSSGGEQR